MPITTGDRLGPYEILSAIGKGGMGEVWLARDVRLDRQVAVKVGDARFSDRVTREAKAIAALNHPNICQIYDVGPDYLVMEYIEGLPPRGPLAVAEAVRIAAGIASALEAAHKKGITHRDLKPGNILVTSSGIKLLDFGLASLEERAAADVTNAATALSVPGAVIGTIAYMAPEQAQGKLVDARSDIFSFGLVLYELLTGRQAFTAESAADTMAAIIRDEPPPPRSPIGETPAWLEALITRCLRKAPDARFQTIGEVRAVLESGSMTAATAAAPGNEPPSIAVLPFANIGGDKENEYFSDGLAEEILNLLAKSSGLRVIARTSSFAFRGKDEDITAIAKALRVKTILEGSVRRAGNRIRVTAQLVEAQNGSHLWSERYDRDMTDVFAIQDEIGQAIADALRVRLTSQTRVKNLEAWEHWLKGVYHRGLNTPAGVLKAKDHFEQASIIDPSYAQAYSGLAFCYFIIAAQGAMPIAEGRRLAAQAAERALALDPSDSDAHTILGNMATIIDYDWRVGEAHHLRALACEHVSSRAHYCYAMYSLLPSRRIDEALTHARQALQIDPLFMLFQFGVGWTLWMSGRAQEAVAHMRRAMELSPDAHLGLMALGFAELAADMPRDAAGTFQRLAEVAPWVGIGAGGVAAALHQAGDHAAATEAAQRFSDADRRSFGAAVYYAIAGESGAMMDALDACYARRDIHLLNIPVMPIFDRYRIEPRFRTLLAEMNLPEAAAV